MKTFSTAFTNWLQGKSTASPYAADAPIQCMLVEVGYNDYTYQKAISSTTVSGVGPYTVVATISTHPYINGDLFNISGSSNTAYNSTGTSNTVVATTSTSITYTSTANPGVYTSGGSVSKPDDTKYLSTVGYVSGTATTHPSNQVYNPIIVEGIKYTEEIATEFNSSPSLSFGDISLANLDGSIDSWVNHTWINRPIKIYYGDVRWPADSFQLIFNGTVADIKIQNIDRLSLQIRDKLERLNTTLYETTLGGTSSNATSLLPLCFGECFNVEPLLVDPINLVYQVHNGPIQEIIEVRDNGFALALTSDYTVDLTNGKFTLLGSPAGQITASIKGATVASSNLLTYSEDFTNGSYTRASGCTVSSNVSTAPNSTTTADIFIEGNTNTRQWIARAYTVSANTYYTFSAYVKANSRNYAGIVIGKSGTPFNRIGYIVDLTTGNITTNYTISSVISYNRFTPINYGNGWWKLAVSVIMDTSSTDLICELFASPDGSTVNYLGTNTSCFDTWGWQLEKRAYPTPYIGTTTTAAPPLYINNPADIISEITTNTTYGSNSVVAPYTGQFSGSDLDPTNLLPFAASSSGSSTVGVYLTDRENLLDVCHTLTASVGAQLVISTEGTLRVIQITDPATVTPVGTITKEDIIQYSLGIEDILEVSAGYVLDYSKNWLVQTDIQTYIADNLKAVFAEEYQTVRSSDSFTKSINNLYKEPEAVQTNLVTTAQAQAECDRRLNILKTKRRLVSFISDTRLIAYELGDPVYLQHTRFSLDTANSGLGTKGIIVSKQVDWANSRTQFKVLI